MKKPLVIGGTYNGEATHWTGDIVEVFAKTGEDYKELYRRQTLALNNKGVVVYIHSSITDSRALELLTEGYFAA